MYGKKYKSSASTSRTGSRMSGDDGFYDDDDAPRPKKLKSNGNFVSEARDNFKSASSHKKQSTFSGKGRQSEQSRKEKERKEREEKERLKKEAEAKKKDDEDEIPQWKKDYLKNFESNKELGKRGKFFPFRFVALFFLETSLPI